MKNECTYRDRNSPSLRIAQLAIISSWADTTGRPVSQLVLGHTAHRTGHEEGVVSRLRPGLFFRIEGVHCCHEVSTLTHVHGSNSPGKVERMFLDVNGDHFWGEKGKSKEVEDKKMSLWK
jgi:hypothetical protein